jgi:50S ribosomal protein L16 3-hydroxylase
MTRASRTARPNPLPVVLSADARSQLARHWGKSTVRLKQASTQLTEADLFSLALESSERLRSGAAGPSPRLFLEHDSRGHRPFSSEVFSPGPLLPVVRDATLDGWAKRLTQVLSGQRFCLVLHDCQRAFQAWVRQVPLVRALQGETIPQGGSDIVTFIGNCRSTPFGIHKDTQHVLTFVVAGRKRFRVWPFEALARRPELADEPHGKWRALVVTPRDKTDERQLRSQSQLLEGDPGDVLYWPPSTWHVAEGDSLLSVTQTLGFNEVESALVTPSRMLVSDAEPARKFVARALPDIAAPGNVPLSLNAFLAPLLESATPRNLEGKVLESWLQLSSSGGFRHGPEPEQETALGLMARLQLRDPVLPILVSPSPSGELLLAANGHCTALPFHPNLVGLVHALNGGSLEDVGALMKRFSGVARVGGELVSVSPSTVRAVLQTLVAQRALVQPAAQTGVGALGTTRHS